MRFLKILAAVLVILAIVIFAARTVMRMRMYKGSRGGERIKMGAATSFYYNASGGSYMNSGETYSAELSGDIVTIRIRLDGVYEEDAEQFETDPSFMKQIDSILEKYNVKKWNGFSLSNQMVLDGRDFGLSVVMDNGEILSAHGYMAWPDGYSGFAAEVRDLFMSVYDAAH